MSKMPKMTKEKEAAPSSGHLLLTKKEIEEKLSRMAYQLLETYDPLDRLIFLGMGTRGVHLCKHLASHLADLANLDLPIGKLILKPSSKEMQEIDITLPRDILCKGKDILIVDDVLNTSYTLALAFTAVMRLQPHSVRTAVLIERSHKSFPIEVNFVGMSLATTLDEYVEVRLTKSAGVYLR